LEGTARAAETDGQGVAVTMKQMDLNNLTKNALLVLGVACAMMAVLIVAASIFTVPGHFHVLAHLIS
jgi:hypothetical protein